MKKIFFIALWVVVYTINTNAQISSNLPSVLNYSILNPCCIRPRKTTISLFYGTPFSGVIGSPKSQILHYQKNITKLLAAFSIKNYSAGPSSSTDFLLSYSHILKINNDLRIALGLNGGFKTFTFNEFNFILDNQLDYAVSGKTRKEILSSANTGIVLIDNYWKFGLSAHNLINTNIYSRGVSNDSILYTTFSAYFDYKIQKDDFLFVPSIIIENDNTDLDIDLNLMTIYKGIVQLGASLPRAKSISFSTGIKRGNLQFNYAYSFPSTEVHSIVTGGHNLFIQLEFNE